MTRQEAVIKIVKITRIIGELKYQLDADDEVEFEALDPEWKHIAEWTQEVCRYMLMLIFKFSVSVIRRFHDSFQPFPTGSSAETGLIDKNND